VQYKVCNFIYTHKQSTAFPATIFMKFASAEQHNSIRIGVSLECADIELLVRLSKVWLLLWQLSWYSSVNYKCLWTDEDCRK
jgi:hypothetical protein